MANKPGQRRLSARMIAVVGGLVLLLIGSALLAEQLDYVLPHPWIALVLLVPAAAAIADGVRLAGQRGWSSIQALARIIAGSLFAAIGIMVSLRVNTGIILPVLMMVLGIGATLRALLTRF